MNKFVNKRTNSVAKLKDNVIINKQSFNSININKSSLKDTSTDILTTTENTKFNFGYTKSNGFINNNKFS